jgi:hypothetical protein
MLLINIKYTGYFKNQKSLNIKTQIIKSMINLLETKGVYYGEYKLERIK